MFSINLKGKIAFVAGIGDDRGFGWAIAKALLEAGATVIVGTWPPVYKIFTESFNKGSFDESRIMSDGSLMKFAKVYALDAAFCFPDQVPEEIKTNKRYAQHEKFTISEVADAVYKEFGKIDILVHSLANGPEVKNPLLKTSRKGYLEALSASSYSFVSLLQHFGPHMNPGSSYLGLTYMASEKAVKGYGGGMSSAKAALESDTRTLALEAGREWGIRVNCISAGAYASRAATAIGFIGNMINYAKANAPLTRPLEGEDVGAAAAFLLSPLAAAITGSIVYVDNGMHAMGTSLDSPELQL